MKRKLLFFLATTMLLPLAMVGHARADIPGATAFIWNIRAGGIWRTEYRRREISRWYQHYEWKLIQKIWLKRRAEGIWASSKTLKSFACHRHCIYRFPNGNVWRIWRWFRISDVRQFWAHYRTGWIGHGNPLIADVPAVDNRFFMTLDDLVMTLPMTPEDPDPGTPTLNENVMIVDENGVEHTGEIGTGSIFDVQNLPDIAGNPDGFIMTTTSLSSNLLPPPVDRITNSFEFLGPGMVLIKTCVGGDNDEGICAVDGDCPGGICEDTGPAIEWIIPQDQPGSVCEGGDNAGDPCADDAACLNGLCVVDHAPAALADQKHQGLIATPTGVDGTELDLDQSLNPLQLYEWELAPNGEVLGAPPGEPDLIIGPPVDLDGDGFADGPVGAPIPLDPTVRDEDDVLDTNAKPVDIAIVEEDQPTAGELAILNTLLANAKLPPLAGPFKLCIKYKWVRRIWSITRRFVMDCWYHHMSWAVIHHVRLTVSTNAHRIWLTKAALSVFNSSHHHYVVGQPPVWRSFTKVNLRFFRVCYRIFCPRPDRIRVKIDELAATVPVDPNDPNSDLMFITTESNENLLPPADVRAGLVPDPLPVDKDGVFIEEIDVATNTLDMGSGGTGIFDGDLTGLESGSPQDVAIVGNQDLANALNNNQLQLYCWPMDKDGNLLKDDVGDGTMLTLGATPAIPVFEDNKGNTLSNPTMLSVEVGIEPVPDPLEDADDGLGGDYNRVGDFKMPGSAGGQEVAIRVTLNRMYIDSDEDASQCPPRQGLPDLQAFEGQVRYLGPPEVFDNNSLLDPRWVGAKLQCTPHIRDWSAAKLAEDLGISEAEADTIYYYGAEVVPCSVHSVQQATQSCVDSANEDCLSEALEVRTALWGDLWPPFNVISFTDIGKEVDAFKSIPVLLETPTKWRAMLRDNQGNPVADINFTDIGRTVDAFKTIAYGEDGPTACIAGTAEVTTIGLTFVPADVTIETGDSIHFTGLLGGFHTVAEVDDEAATVWNGGFHSPASASEFTQVFNSAGVFFYICEPHVESGMRGKITVTAAQ